MTGDGSRGKQVRAVLFAAIMVVSMVAAGVGGFAGSAAAEVSNLEGVSAENVTANNPNAVGTVTLSGINKTGDRASIFVSNDNPNVSIQSATITDTGNFDSSNVSVSVSPDTNFNVVINGSDTPTGDVTLDVTLDTKSADPGETVTYDAISNSNEEASGSFVIQKAPTVDTDASSISPTEAEVNGTQEYTVDLAIDDVPDEAATVDIGIDDFDILDKNGNIEDDATIDYTADDVTNGTASFTATFNATAPSDPSLTGAVFVDEIRPEDGNQDIYNNQQTVDDISVQDNTITVNQDGSAEYETIQNAVDNASSGATVEVASGTYNESVTINTIDLTLEGAGNSASGTVLEASSSGSGNGITVNASNLTVRDLRITDYSNGIRLENTHSNIVFENVDSVGNSNRGMEIRNSADLDNLELNNVNFSNNERGIRGATTSSIDGLTITDSSLNNNTQAIYFAQEDSDDPSGRLTDVFISDTEIIDSEKKGIYTTKLSDATFDNITIDGITSDTYGYNNGIDINLKYDDYSNITIRDSTVANVSEGDPGTPSASAAVAVKARGSTSDDSSSYTSNPATLDDVTIDNVTIEDSFNGLRVGEFGTDYSSGGGPTSVTVTDSTFQNNSGYHIRDLPSSLDLSDALNNRGNTFNRQVTAQDGAGNITDNSIFAAIQPAVDAASDGDTVSVSGGTYNESVEIGTNGLTLKGAGADSTTIIGNGTVGDDVETAITVDDGSGPVRNVTIEGFTVENPNGKYGIFAGTGSTNKDPDGIGGLVIRDNVVQDVSTQSSGSALTGGPAGIGIRADYGTDGNPGIEISNNEIDNVENLQGGPEPVGITLKSFTGDAAFGFDSNGDSATDTSSPPATDTDILNNEISNISSNGGYATKGISVSGEFDDVNITDNNLTDIESPGGTAIAITLSENNQGKSPEDYKYDIDGDGNGERIGPQEFNISANTISSVNAADARSVNLGGYEEFGDHTVSQNTINDGTVTRYAGDQAGYQPGDGDALNLVDNTFTDQNDQLLVSDPSQSADLDAVLSNNAFEGQVVTTEDNAGNVNSISGAIQPAVNVVSDGGAVSVSSGTYKESVTVDQANITIESAGALGEPTINASGIGPAVNITAQNVTVSGFTLETDSGDGVTVSNVDATAGDGIIIANNNIVDVSGDGVNADSVSDGLVDATENYWGSENGPNAENGSNISANVASDPFLTTQVENLQSTGDGTPREFATELRLDGGLNALAFPAPSDRTLNETVDTDNVDTVYVYDNSEQTWLTPGDGTGTTFNTSMEPGALDVFVVVVEDGEQAAAVMEFENDFDGQANFDETDATVSTESWNLIGAANASNSSGTAFQGADVLVTTDDPYQDPNRQPFGVDSKNFSPYRGYWVYAEGESGGSDEVVSATFDGLTLQEYLESVNLDN